MITASDIRREHQNALATLTRTQRRALGRLERAGQMAVFNHRSLKENLSAIFESEAEVRSEPDAGWA